ncbi:RNA 2',3'-cyclic phosphodiesterase [Oribacterium sp. P6A1]|uniref:RNA 2',3'-cyclic phosphodiesterase n=1 Tax=Oribacterium sp. P6A1 TaxID=1410612 RepID=UPI00056AA4AE|nr:RNA 2',3'-cyclic phosphodiesterase [Oribacterium sp. P6A1]
MRLFIALNFNENMKYALLKMQNALKQNGVRGNFTRDENLHMTLVFIGESDDPKKIERIMRDVPFSAFDINVSGLKCFKDMVFAKVEANPDLMDYVNRLRSALSGKDIDFDTKKFTPHITLVRRAGGAKGYEKIGNVLDETMKVSRISLMKSEQSKQGMVYTELGYVKAF